MGIPAAAFMGLFSTMFLVEAATVIRPPKIETSGSSTTIFRSNKVTMTCVASGSPEPSYYWEKDGRRLDNTPGIQWTGSGTFEISSASTRNSGTYQCFAHNKYGTAMSERFTIKAAELGTVTSRSITEHVAVEGEYLKLSCNSMGSYPPAVYSWVIKKSIMDTQSTDVWMDDRLFTDHQGNLHFANLQTSDAKGTNVYQCITYNHLLEMKAASGFSRIKVLAGNGTSVPLALEYVSPSPTIVLRGSMVDIHCFFSGNPTPSFLQWRRTDGKKVNAVRTRHTLIFKSIVDDDKGEYQCYPVGQQNLAGRVTLIVDLKPTWMVANNVVQKPTDANITVGRNHTFFCAGEGKPDLTTTWYIDAKEVSSSTPRRGVEISQDQDNRTMTVSGVQKERADGSSDLMNVQCALQNDHGILIGGAYLNVLLPTLISGSERPHNWQLVYGERAIFNCEAESDPSTPIKITWLWNGRPVNPDDPNIMQLGNNSLKIITNNQPKKGAEFEGVYECFASNSYSEDRACAMLILPKGPIPGQLCSVTTQDCLVPLSRVIRTLNSRQMNYQQCRKYVDGLVSKATQCQEEHLEEIKLKKDCKCTTTETILLFSKPYPDYQLASYCIADAFTSNSSDPSLPKCSPKTIRCFSCLAQLKPCGKYKCMEDPLQDSAMQHDCADDILSGRMQFENCKFLQMEMLTLARQLIYNNLYEKGCKIENHQVSCTLTNAALLPCYVDQDNLRSCIDDRIQQDKQCSEGDFVQYQKVYNASQELGVLNTTAECNKLASFKETTRSQWSCQADTAWDGVVHIGIISVKSAAYTMKPFILGLIAVYSSFLLLVS